MSRLIFNNLPDAQDLLALSRPEVAAHVLEHLRAVGGNPLKQQYSHPDNLAISVKEQYPLPFRDKVHKAIFSACEWLRTKGYLIEMNNQGFFEITEEGNRIDVATNMIGVPVVPIGASKPDAPEESIPRLFISHSWEDKPLVRLLETQLRANRIEVWVDHRGVRAGDNLPEEISNALQWCTTLLLIWSGASSNSYWVKLEWTNALALRKVIIPCLVDEVPLPPILSHKAYVKLSNINEGVSELLYSLRRTDGMSEAPTSTQPETTADPSLAGSASEDAQVIKNSSPHSSTQVKILSLLSDGSLTRSEISRGLVSLYGSETRPAVVSQKLEQLIQEELVTERRSGDSESRLELTPKGHRNLAGCLENELSSGQ